MPRVTLLDVAKAAGVSKMTASRALREHSDVAAETREKVRKLAAELGYVPNQMASMLSAKSSFIVPMIIPSISNSVFADIVAHAQPLLLEAGYQMLLFNTDYSLDREEKAIAALMAWSPAAIILSGVDHTAQSRHQLKKAGIPVIEMMDLAEDPIDLAVGFDHVQAGADMARYLIGRGYKRFAFCGSQLDMDTRAYKRFAGFRDMLEANGLSQPFLVNIDDHEGILTEDDFQGLLNTVEGFDCIYFSNDDLAVSALLFCSRLGISVPDQLAIAGFNDIPLGRQITPRLTTTRTPRGLIGEKVAQYALDAIKDKEGIPRVLDLKSELLPRESA